MRFPIGQPLRLSTQTYDLNGDLANATSISMVLTKPDATTATYSSPTNPSTGLYYQDVPASDMATVGQYRQTWTSLGTAAGVDWSVFDVYDPASERFVLSLADAKQHLNIPAASSIDDEELRFFLAATTRVVERLAGVVVPRTVTEVVRQRGTAYSVVFQKTPVLSVTSLTPVDGSAAYDVTALYVDNPLAGIVRRTDGGVISGGPWTGIYRAGRAEVPANVGLAARMLVQHLWETQRGGPMMPPRMAAEAEGGIPGIWFAIPHKVSELLEGESAPIMAY